MRTMSTKPEAPATLYGPWDYSRQKEPGAYDATETYKLAGDWVSGRGNVEDWGCGGGWMKQFVHPARGARYVGLDGAWSKWCDKQVDLRTYTNAGSCAVMRHVLEHNWEWRDVARNFMASWADRAAMVLFIPPQPEELDVGGPEWPVPDLAVSGPELFEILGDTVVDTVQLWDHSPTIQWSWEGVIFMERS